MEFHRICQEFRPYHKNALNVALHLVTTPAGIVSALSLIAHAAKEFKLPELPQICPYFTLEVQQVAVAFYCWTLFINMPVRLWIVNTMCMALCSYATTVLNLDLYVSLGLMVAAYVGQDVSHWITGESTYQSSYMKNSSWMSMLLQHTYYLMPCVLDAIPHMDTTFLYWLVASNNVVFSRVNQPEGRSRLAFMRQWVLDQKPSKDHTTHWWFATLPEDAKQCFSDIATSNTMMD
eukprot:9476507-Pyramimonas_sp.AAC.1